jgi:hypothetical protein
MESNLKQAFEADLSALKQLELSVIPAKTYYRDILRGLLFMYALFVGLQLLACLFASLTGAWHLDFYDPDRAPAAVRVVKMIGGIIFSSGFFLLFVGSNVKNYVIFKHLLKPNLQTGDYLNHKVHQALQLYFTLFGSLVLFCICVFDQTNTFFAALAAFIFSSIPMVMIIEWEVSRIGMSVLSSAMVSYFSQAQKG